MFNTDQRIVLTLDAGGTNFVFSAIRSYELLVKPITKPAHTDNLDMTLQTLIRGFQEVIDTLPSQPVAISFAFPGPADYRHGIIGDLPNFPAFRGGVALGPLLEERFGIPVFINNDGNLFAYGEAFAGLLPHVNQLLEDSGSSRRYRNIVGITLGTGFGAGVVIDGKLLFGDNGCGGDIWCLRNKQHADYIIEESVSIRAVKRVYNQVSGMDNQDLQPKDIFDIAEGVRCGNRIAAIQAFEALGEALGDGLCEIINFADGLVVIGGGLSGASKYIYPAMYRELNGWLGTFSGERFPHIQSHVYNLDDPQQMESFLHDGSATVRVPYSTRTVPYVAEKKVGIATSALGANHAILLGAYAFALQSLNHIKI